MIDLYKIGNVEKNNAEQSKVLNTTATVIRNIFADKKLLKLAFDFYLEDMKMIRNAGKGAEFTMSYYCLLNLFTFVSFRSF